MAAPDLLSILPLERTWLADAIEVMLHRPDGVAEVEALVIGIGRLGRNLGKTPAETITRALNDWTINAGDVGKKPRGQLFERVGPSTWRLLTWPMAPDLVELQEVRFADGAYRVTWEIFVDRAKKIPKWEGMSKRERLEAFSKNLMNNEGLRNLLATYGGQPPAQDAITETNP